MALEIRSLTVTCPGKPELVAGLIDRLTENGYRPLISLAKQRYADVFGAGPPEESLPEDRSRDMALEYAYRQRAFRYRERPVMTIAGDIFDSPSGTGVLYMALNVADPISRAQEKESRAYLEVGFIGDTEDTESLAALVQCLQPHLQEFGVTTEGWSTIEPSNSQFIEVSRSEGNRFLPAHEVTEEHRKLSQILRDQATRDLALLVKRSGGMLSADLAKRAAAEPTDTDAAVQCFSKIGLVANEYVVICRKTSNQVNRVDNREKIDRMAEMGVLCSCGSPISQERIEELISPSGHLVRLLDQSYWMSAVLVDTLLATGIPEKCVVLITPANKYPKNSYAAYFTLGC